MYLGVILVATGMPVFVPSLAGFLIMLALIPILLIRIRIEERLLADEFGAEYQAYQRNTPKLIPFIF